jgi:hypothetical protein
VKKSLFKSGLLKPVYISRQLRPVQYLATEAWFEYVAKACKGAGGRGLYKS